MINLAAEGGYQVFTLGSSEWFWLIFSAVTALVAIAVGFYLVRGVLAAALGESMISPRIAAHLVKRLRDTSPVRSQAEADEDAADLTTREVEILRLVAEGKENSQIAGELYISPKTVKNHVANILDKLAIENRIQAAVFAVRTGIAR